MDLLVKVECEGDGYVEIECLEVPPVNRLEPFGFNLVFNMEEALHLQRQLAVAIAKATAQDKPYFYTGLVEVV